MTTLSRMPFRTVFAAGLAAFAIGLMPPAAFVGSVLGPALGTILAVKSAAAAPVKSEPEKPTTEKTASEGEPMASVAIDVATGKVLSANRASERRYPASTTKLMTAYVALNMLRDGKAVMNTPVVMTRRANAEPPSKMGFKPGTVIRLDMALRMMLVKSANDMAYAIAQTLGGGSMEDFVDMMNADAARLGMKDTHFVNPNGLPQDGQYSSPKDLAILGMTIRREFPAFANYFGTEAIALDARVLKNGNKLLGRFDGADGMKTGYICASGFNLVSSATRNGRTIVAVVMGANGTIPRERLAASLLEDGFKTDPKTINKTVDELPVSSGPPIDTSDYICSSRGRTDRANERVEEAGRDEKFGSPYLHDLGRPPVTLQVSIGGAAGTAKIPAGVSILDAYGIPIPTPRPEDGAPVTGALPSSTDAPTTNGPGDQIAKPADAKASPIAGSPTADATAARSDDAAASIAVENPAQQSAGLDRPQRPVAATSFAHDGTAVVRNKEIEKILSDWASQAKSPSPAIARPASQAIDASENSDGKTGRLSIYRAPVAMRLRPAESMTAADAR